MPERHAVAPASTEPFMDEESKDLDLLRCVQTHAPELMTSESWGNLGRLEEKARRIRRAREAAMHERWAPTLTPERIAELERMFTDRDATITQDDAEAWFTAVHIAQAWLPVIGDKWYRTPISKLITAKSRDYLPSRRGQAGRAPRSSRNRRQPRRSRAPARPRSSDDDDDDDDLLAPRVAV